MMRLLARSSRCVLLAGALGLLFESGGCGLFEIGRAIGRFNPCGTILACDPTTYEFLTSGYQGPGADPSRGIYFTTLPPYTTNNAPVIVPP